MSEDTPTSDKSKEEILQATEEHFDQKEAKQNEALNAIAQGEELEQYTTVELGDLELEVKEWVPGDVEQTITRVNQIAERGDDVVLMRQMESILTALDEMTENGTYDRSFWRAYYDKYGQSGVLVATETILSPAMEEMEALEEGVEGFRQDKSGNVVRSGGGE